MKSKKTLSLIISVILILVLLSSCASKIPDGFNEEKLIESCQNVIDSLNSFDYDNVYNEESEDLKKVLSSEQLSTAIDETLKKAGAFDKISSYATAEVKQNNITYAKVVLSCKYENKSIIYTMVFDENYLLCGFFFK